MSNDKFQLAGLCSLLINLSSSGKSLIKVIYLFWCVLGCIGAPMCIFIRLMALFGLVLQICWWGAFRNSPQPHERCLASDQPWITIMRWVSSALFATSRFRLAFWYAYINRLSEQLSLLRWARQKVCKSEMGVGVDSLNYLNTEAPAPFKARGRTLGVCLVRHFLIGAALISFRERERGSAAKWGPN